MFVVLMIPSASALGTIVSVLRARLTLHKDTLHPESSYDGSSGNRLSKLRIHWSRQDRHESSDLPATDSVPHCLGRSGRLRVIV
jgi:hypothetical protein